MGVFNQDLGKTPITATLIQEVINDRKRTYPTCHITEEELEEVITVVVESIYYRCKAGDIPFERTWRFDGAMFGVKKMPESFLTEAFHLPVGENITKERQRIKDYIERRFVELGFTYAFDDNTCWITLGLPFEFDMFGAAQQVFAQTIAADLVPVVPMSEPSPLFLFPDVLRCDALDDREPDITTNSAPHRK